uniref:Uncharacterized protein n=1 Tax=Meloidogyne incognita TaxID=6306 RepID=A0A914LIZ8_MELIC
MSSRDLPGLLESCTQTLVTSIRNYTEDQLSVLLNDESKLNSLIDNLSQVCFLLF